MAIGVEADVKELEYLTPDKTNIIEPSAGTSAEELAKMIMEKINTGIINRSAKHWTKSAQNHEPDAWSSAENSHPSSDKRNKYLKAHLGWDAICQPHLFCRDSNCMSCCVS